jgi:hypothetical protein
VAEKNIANKETLAPLPPAPKGERGARKSFKEVAELVSKRDVIKYQ